MRGAEFSPENWAEALYVPPLKRKLLMRSAAAWERVGAGLSLPFSGVHVIDATKQFRMRAPLRASPDNEPLRDAIRAAIARKPKGHDFDYSRGVAGQMTRHMSHTGG